MSVLKFPYEVEWEDGTKHRLEQDRSLLAMFHPYHLSDGERLLARFEPASAGCLNLFGITDWIGRAGESQVLVRKRWFARADPSWPALESGELLSDRVNYQVHVGASPVPLFVVKSTWLGTLHAINRLPVTASPEEERLALLGLLLALAHRHLRSS
mgnify:FL=1